MTTLDTTGLDASEAAAIHDILADISRLDGNEGLLIQALAFAMASQLYEFESSDREAILEKFVGLVRRAVDYLETSKKRTAN
jgi:hypothetical protein